MRKKAVNPIDEAVGVRIRLLRQRRKMSQSELGKALDVTFQQVQKYEKGTNRVGASRLQMVADALNVPIAELFGGTASNTSRATAKSVAFDPESLRLAEAFVKIADKEVRALLVDVAEAMARKSASRN
jgi:transcriptional regulator with XRE-family HTH domain